MAMRRIMFVCLLRAGVGIAPADEPAKQPATKNLYHGLRPLDARHARC
jgi:hypothetical protein